VLRTATVKERYAPRRPAGFEQRPHARSPTLSSPRKTAVRNLLPLFHLSPRRRPGPMVQPNRTTGPSAVLCSCLKSAERRPRLPCRSRDTREARMFIGAVVYEPWLSSNCGSPTTSTSACGRRDIVYAIIHALGATLDGNLPCIGLWARSTAALRRTSGGRPTCRALLRSWQSDHSQAAPARAGLFNRVTPGFWGQRLPRSCVEHALVTIVISLI
jgi:hypothetical protein